EKALSTFLFLAALMLLMPIALTLLTDAAPSVARRAAYLTLWPLAWLPALAGFPLSLKTIGVFWLPGVLVAGLALVGFTLAVARHKGTTARWTIVCLAALLLLSESAVRETVAWPDKINFHGDRFEWRLLDHTNLAPEADQEGFVPPDTMKGPSVKQPGEVVVLCMGACAVRKSGLIMGDVFPTQLPKLLTQGNVQVLNVGVPEYNSFQTLIHLETCMQPAWEPDVVVLYLGNRETFGAQARGLWEKLQAVPKPRQPLDLWAAMIEGPSWLPTLIRHSGLVRWHWQRQLAYAATEYQQEQSALPTPQQAQNVLPPTNREVLQRFAELGREHRFTPIFVPFVSTDGTFFNDYHAALMREVATEYELPFLDLRDAVREYEEKFLDPNFLSSSGHKIVAKALKAKIYLILSANQI
ncbi:MAG: hypothetical protein ACTSXZ_11415, partial [Alphaproteobacteria bacterium]